MLDRPILIYDGLCGMCRRWVLRWKARTGRRVLYVPYQAPLVPRALGVSRERARRSAQLVETNGKVYGGAEAVFRALARAPELRIAARLVLFTPALLIAQGLYRPIARHRRMIGRVDRFLYGTKTAPLHYAVIRALFLRGLGMTHLLAFASLRTQVLGLYGRRGVLPIRELLSSVRTTLGEQTGVRTFPSVFWLDASDRTLVRACRLGELLSLSLVLGAWPRPTLFGLWLLYLSFVTVGQDFLSFQWDTLLLETTLHALFVASPRSSRLFVRRREDPPWQAVLLMRMLALRFFYEAGLAKVRSADPTWRKLTACVYHYETQPLPTPLSPIAHRLPRPIHRVSTLATLATECIAPFAAFAPRRIRRAAFTAHFGLQLLIAFTGNYGFFNVLSITLALWLLDDAAVPLPRLAPLRRAPLRTRGLERFIAAAGAVLLLPLAIGVHLLRYGSRHAPPAPIDRLVRRVETLRSTGAYGLFSVMTRRRLEIVVEGSDDGDRWLPYEFRFKPGDPRRRPGWVAPHQPRIDWQMWFAALEPPPTWFVRLLVRLLEGAPEVERVFENRPFGDHPPKYVRAVLYEYRFTDRETQRRTGERWSRRWLGEYFPPVLLSVTPTLPRFHVANV
jgi:predicted DCC family thiol-disulfide oxidoreductase YuxK